MTDKIEILKKLPIFSAMSENELVAAANAVTERNCRHGEILFMEGDAGAAVHFVIEGKVKIYKTAEDGREHILDIAVQGDAFAEVVLFDDMPYPATAQALEDSRIALIRNSDLEKVLRQNPDIAVGMIRILNKRLMEAQSQIKSLALQDTRARTAEMLLRLASEQGRRVRDGIELDLNISRQELAGMVGTTRETVTRMLAFFKKKGLLDMDRSRILIKDLSELEDWIR